MGRRAFVFLSACGGLTSNWKGSEPRDTELSRSSSAFDAAPYTLSSRAHGSLVTGRMPLSACGVYRHVVESHFLWS